jgi:hypothetical protein
MNQNDFVKFVTESVSGTTFVTAEMDVQMDKKMRKTDNPYIGKGLVKREKMNGVIGFDYGHSVNMLAEKEGKEERVAKRHPWGDMDSKSLFRIHRETGKHYLTMKIQAKNVEGYFLPDGTEVSKDELVAFIPEKGKKSSTQEDLDGEVIVCDISLDNIKNVKIKGEIVFLGE